MQACASGALGKQEIPFSSTDRIIAIGSDRMMAAVAQARHGVLQQYLKPTHRAIGSINSPMHDERDLRPVSPAPRRPTAVLTLVWMTGARIALAPSHFLWTSGPKLAHENKKARGWRGLNLVRL
jgi:hypothetical protein